MTESKLNLKYSDDENDDDYDSSEDDYLNNKNYTKIASSVSLNDENIIQKKLRSMDIRMDNILYNLNMEVNWNDITRGNPISLNKFRYLIPDIRLIQDYKKEREKKLKKHGNTSIPEEPDNTVYGVNENILENIDLNKNLSPKDIFYTLLSFYKNQISNYINESELLISRWIRFCSDPNPNEMESLQELFENAHSIIYTNLRDSIKRYTNLNLFDTELKIKLKSKMNIKSNTEEEIKKEKEKIKEEFYSKVDFKLGYDITDFLVYIHHYIGKLYLEKPIQLYFINQKLLVKSELFDLLKNYEIVQSEKNIRLLPDSLQFLNKVNTEIPLKLCSYDTFFKKCSALLRHYKIDTEVSAEDGRRLAYEIDFYFNELFNDHLIDIQSYLDKNAQKQRKNDKLNSIKSKENDDDQKTFYVNMPTYIRKADWIDDIQINPEFSDEYYSYNKWLFKEKEFDYELKLNYELIKINNLKKCILKLQDITRSRFNEFSTYSDFEAVDKKSPLNNSEIKPQFEIKRSTS